MIKGARIQDRISKKSFAWWYFLRTCDLIIPCKDCRERDKLTVGKAVKCLKISKVCAEIPEFLWYKVEKGIKNLREVNILEGIYCIKPEDPADD